MAKNKSQLDRLLGKKNNNTFLDKLIEYKRFLSIFSGVGIAIGAALIFIYCFFYINYIPSQLSLGDSLSYIFISLGFGLLYLFFLFFHFFLVFCFFHKNFLGENQWALYFSGVVFFPIVLYLYFFIFGLNYKILILLLFYYFIIYLFFKLFYKLSARSRVLFFTLLSLYPLPIEGVFDAFLDNTLSRLSIKMDYASIRLVDEEFLFISKITDEQGITLKTSCNILDKNKLIHDVNILWSIGRESLIEIAGDGDEENRRIRLTVNNDNMKPIRISSPRKCIFKEFGNIFGSIMYNIKDDEFNKVKNFISRYKKDDISKVTVYTVLEPSPYEEIINEKPPEDWMKSITEKLSPNISKDILFFKELAKYEYTQYCKENILSSHELKDCDGINKGIILELELKNKVRKNNERAKGWFKFEKWFNSTPTIARVS